MDVAIRRCGPFFVKMLFLPNHLWYTVGNSSFNRKVPAGEGIKSEEAELPGKRAREEKVGQLRFQQESTCRRKFFILRKRSCFVQVKFVVYCQQNFESCLRAGKAIEGEDFHEKNIGNR